MNCSHGSRFPLNNDLVKAHDAVNPFLDIIYLRGCQISMRYEKSFLINRRKLCQLVFNISLATFSEIKDCQEIKLLTHYIVKEDAQVLYGFATEEERELFKLLLSVNGIGPNTSRLILSSMSVGEVLNAIATENVKAIQSVKGIGTKTAQRVVIELKDKAKKASWADATKINVSYNNNKYEALSALVALGFPKSGAEAVLDKIIKAEGIQLSVEELIKKSLKLL